ncbi:predicted protein [Histoplasma capsulatum G186AR]|uniref:Uncharacterized protein n=1 Tax=Ajellomyces capsulatus (strain G186AR / H82 / ATCC MYA-2454 / RMSCC 2432) TaxID=447093 RepID=C0NRF4_AJECG|nr:uncharacterized protein HCBG_05584 [Histoplasma capsulatum G186AR]EEH06268.1 predicted protein [Histoplasma capsulatum G186AR]
MLHIGIPRNRVCPSVHRGSDRRAIYSRNSKGPTKGQPLTFSERISADHIGQSTNSLIAMTTLVATRKREFHDPPRLDPVAVPKKIQSREYLESEKRYLENPSCLAKLTESISTSEFHWPIKDIRSEEKIS